MIASIATFASAKLNQPSLAGTAPLRAVAPARAAPLANERPPQPAPVLSASSVALAPVAMSALIQAQEYMSNDTPELVRAYTAQWIDNLISRLDDGDPPPPPTDGAPLTVRRLQTVRQQLV